LNATGLGAVSMDQVTNFPVKVRMLRDSYEHHCTDKPGHYSPFRPGMSATVEVRTARVANVIAVPIKAITSREDTTAVSGDDSGGWRNRGEEEVAQVKSSDEKSEPFTVVFVYSPISGTASLRVVKTGVQDDRFIEILEGLKGDEQVITGPYAELSRDLKPGDRVKLEESNTGVEASR
ncbi:MAG: efflux RND transporter periplasmic adaptor subunit, partial [Bacteroidota bacterium]